MDKNTGSAGVFRPHIDILERVYGHAFPVNAIDTIVLGKRPPVEREDLDTPWLYFPAGRGE